MPPGQTETQTPEDTRRELEREHTKATRALAERVKELRFLYEVTNAVRVRRSIPELVAEIVELIAPAWQYPEVTRARIEVDSNRYTSSYFREGSARLASEIHAGGRARGQVEVFYVEERPPESEGPFLLEERQLIDGLAQAIGEAIELRDAEEELTHYRERLEQLVETRTRALELARHALDRAGEAAFWFDVSGHVFDVNQKACSLLEYTREELLGMHAGELETTFPIAGFRAAMTEIARLGGSRTSERTALTKSGRRLPVEIVTSVSEHRGKEFALALVRDITERNRAAAELEAARSAAEAANRAKSAFLAHMSHEIRTPMNAVLGFAQLLQRDSTLDAGQREQVDTILRSGEHLLGIINDVLEMSKIEAGHVLVEPENFDVRTLIADLERMFREQARAQGIAFTVEAVASIPTFARGNQGKIRQIVVNLLGNALKFTKNGKVELGIDWAPRASPHFELRFAVADTGTGIAEEELALLFREFQQASAGRSARGSGLGLAISRRYARLMGGDVSAKSELGKGSTFTATLEVEHGTGGGAALSRAPRRVVRLAPGARVPRVLVVDDHDDSRVFLRELFGKAGFHVVEAKNGTEASLLLEREVPELVLLDVNMPETSGVELLERLRARDDGREIAVIVVSASVLDDAERAAVGVRADAFVRKPVDVSELLQLVGTLLGVTFLAEGEESSSPPSSQRKALSESALMAVPVELRREIRRAAERADARRLRALLAGLGAESRELAHGLAELVDSFDYDTLLALTADSENQQS